MNFSIIFHSAKLSLGVINSDVENKSALLLSLKKKKFTCVNSISWRLVVVAAVFNKQYEQGMMRITRVALAMRKTEITMSSQP